MFREVAVVALIEGVVVVSRGTHLLLLQLLLLCLKVLQLRAEILAIVLRAVGLADQLLLRVRPHHHVVRLSGKVAVDVLLGDGRLKRREVELL